MREYITVNVVIVLPKGCYIDDDGPHGPPDNRRMVEEDVEAERLDPRKRNPYHGPGHPIPPDQINAMQPAIVLYPKEINPAGQNETGDMRAAKVQSLNSLLAVAQAVFDGT